MVAPKKIVRVPKKRTVKRSDLEASKKELIESRKERFRNWKDEQERKNEIDKNKLPPSWLLFLFGLIATYVFIQNYGKWVVGIIPSAAAIIALTCFSAAVVSLFGELRNIAKKLPQWVVLILSVAVAVFVGWLFAKGISFLSQRGAQKLASTAKVETRLWVDACEIYYMANGVPPSQLSDGLNLNIKRVDPWGNKYLYRYSNNCLSVSSRGADGVAGTPDDIKCEQIIN